MVLDDEVGEGGGETGLDGEGPGAGGAERGEEAAKTAGGAVLRRAGHRRPRPSPGSIGGRSAGARAGGRLFGAVWCCLLSGLVAVGGRVRVRSPSAFGACGDRGRIGRGARVPSGFCFLFNFSLSCSYFLGS